MVFSRLQKRLTSFPHTGLGNKVAFRMINYILAKAYRMNLITLEILFSLCIIPLKVSWEGENVTEVKGKMRRFVTRVLFLFQFARTAHFLAGFGLRMAGLQTGPSGEYGMSNQLLDLGWLFPLTSTIIYRFEYTRKLMETMKMINQAHHLEKDEEWEGKDLINIVKILLLNFFLNIC